MITTAHGRLRIFDAHTHFFSHGFYTELARQAGLHDAEALAKKLNWDIPSREPTEVGRRWVDEMDAHGVDRMVSIHTLPGDLDSAGAGVRESNGRLVGYVMVNPQAPDALATVERAVVEYGFRGVALFPSMFRFAIQSDAAYAIYDLANRHGLNVFVHCGVLKVMFRVKLGLPTAFDVALANPLLLQRPASEFPKANFIIPHLGSGLMRELLMLADVAHNVYADTSGMAGWARYLDGPTSPADALRHVVSVMGPQRVLFGSDSTFFPRGWRRDVFDQQLRVFEQAGLTGDDARLILGGNLDRLLAAG